MQSTPMANRRRSWRSWVAVAVPVLVLVLVGTVLTVPSAAPAHQLWAAATGGGTAFATWQEAELMEIPMTTGRGTADVEELGVHPRAMREVLGG